MVIGGQAVLVYGEPRLTKDIDITLGVGIDKIGKVLDVISQLKLKVLVRDPIEFARKTMVIPASDQKSGIRIDFILSDSQYKRRAIQRAKKKRIRTTFVKFASLEDVTIHKIIAGRARDIEDVRSILLRNPNFDSRYIFKWLRDFDRSLEQDYSGCSSPCFGR